jgi:hypothetical protein
MTDSNPAAGPDTHAMTLVRSGEAADHGFRSEPVGSCIMKCPTDDDWDLVLLQLPDEALQQSADQSVDESASDDDDWSIIELDIPDEEPEET